MSSRGGRDRMRREYPSRSEEKSHHGRSNAPPSRHLWVGNLSHSLTERALSDHFRQFGELESVAFQPGRSYAFINFINDGAAFAAIEALQGFILAGNALRIEFAKAEKSSTSLHDEDYLQRRDEPRAPLRGSPFPQRDSRVRHISPVPISHRENPKTDNKSAEPSEVLWIGFPQLLKVDEDILWKAFSPFGEIEKISAFPGRTYAFVRFRNLGAACRAKETLQGKLFGNPRVHICFARNESGTSNSARNLSNDPPSPRIRSYGHQGSPENFQHDRYYESSSVERSRRSPRFVSNLESGHPDDTIGLERKGNRWASRNDPFEHQRFQEVGHDVGLPGNMYERRSPSRDRGANFHDFAPQKFPRQGPFYDDAWDLPEDALLYHGAKKMKTSSIPPESELPEYPFSEPEQVKHVLPRVLEFPRHEALDNNFNSGRSGFHKQIPDPPVNMPQSYGERKNSRNASYDAFQAAPVSLPQNPVEWKRSTPEPHQPSASVEWKWEGTIAKGGTPICRARCFPVGKVLDMILPEFLDCTARTGLDMLAKHYYQAASAWVVFFVPGSDADMGFYNEFMNYLGEKQRAAVAKLDDKTTLFLVPPSDFSEKVLKVPGKLSISGVILRLEQPSSTVGSLPLPPERPDTNVMSFHGEAPTTFSSPMGPYPPAPPLPTVGKPRINASLPGLPPAPPIPYHANMNMAPSISDNRQDHPPHQRESHPQHLQNSSSGGINIAPQRAGGDSMVSLYDPVMPRVAKETTSSSNYRPGSPAMQHYAHQEPQSVISSSIPSGAIQQEQLAQLASFLGNSGQAVAGLSMGQDLRHSSTISPSDNAYRTSHRFPLPNNQMMSDHPSSQYSQVQQFQQQQMSNIPPMPQREFSTNGQGNAQEEADADPQKRLQATLELAATLLQQIQQGKT